MPPSGPPLWAAKAGARPPARTCAHTHTPAPVPEPIPSRPRRPSHLASVTQGTRHYAGSLPFCAWPSPTPPTPWHSVRAPLLICPVRAQHQCSTSTVTVKMNTVTTTTTLTGAGKVLRASGCRRQRGGPPPDLPRARAHPQNPCLPRARAQPHNPCLPRARAQPHNPCIGLAGAGKILLAAGGSVEPFWAMYQQHLKPEVGGWLDGRTVTAHSCTGVPRRAARKAMYVHSAGALLGRVPATAAAPQARELHGRIAA